MRRTEVLQGIRLMKFEEILDRTRSRELSQGEAASVLGVSERTFRRWRDRFEADGAEGLYDRRLGKVSARRVPVDTVIEVLDLFDTRYFDFTARHFWDKLVLAHDFKRSYNWVRLTLQAHGRTAKAPRRGAHRRKRPRRPLPGMMLHQDGSTHEWVPGQWWDLIVTMDDATSDIHSAFLVEEEGTMSTFRALGEVIAATGLFCSLYADRASHYWHTPEAGGKVDRDNPTQVGRALAQLGIELIPAYSPEARGRSERMFGTLQKRLPQELRLAGITTVDEANRFLRETFLPDHNRRFAIAPEEPGSAFVAFAGNLDDILCVQEERTVAGDNTVRYKKPKPADPGRPSPPPLRQGQGAGARIPRRHTCRVPRPAALGLLHSPRGADRRARQKGRVIRFDARQGRGLVHKAAPSPQPQQQQLKRSIDVLPKPVNSICSRQCCLETMTMTTNNVSGGCMCGAIRYEANQPHLFTSLCHCRMCQRWTGSPIFGSAAFVRESVSFTKGTPKTHKSSAVCERGFCADCGSSLFTLYSSGGVFDTVIFIGIGTFDDPEIAPPDVHYGAEAELSWMHRDDGIPRIAIDVDDPAEQNALLEKLMSEGADRRTRDTSQPG